MEEAAAGKAQPVRSSNHRTQRCE